jgi:hypothetical protein
LKLRLLALEVLLRQLEAVGGLVIVVVGLPRSGESITASTWPADAIAQRDLEREHAARPAA